MTGPCIFYHSSRLVLPFNSSNRVLKNIKRQTFNTQALFKYLLMSGLPLTKAKHMVKSIISVGGDIKGKDTGRRIIKPICKQYT